MPEHEAWCCRSPQSECARAGGCSGSCNCGAGDGDQCRPVTLASGEMIPVLGGEPLSPEGVAALGELVAAVRAKAATENPPDEGSGVLYARIEAARGGLNWRQVAAQAGVRFSVLFRIGQGRMPSGGDLAATEAWLERR